MPCDFLFTQYRIKYVPDNIVDSLDCFYFVVSRAAKI